MAVSMIDGDFLVTNEERRSLVAECEAAARNAVHSELTTFAEARGAQTVQIGNIVAGLTKTERLFEEAAKHRTRIADEQRDQAGKIRNLEQDCGELKLAQANYEKLDNKLDSLEKTMNELLAARNRDADRKIEHRWLLIVACVGNLGTFVMSLILHFAFK